MKKIFIILFFIFGYISITFSVNSYRIDSVSIKVNNKNVSECTQLNIWQPWQKVNGTVLIDEKNNKIVLDFHNKTIYRYIESSNFIKNSTTINTYMLADSTFLYFYNTNENEYLYIFDNANKIEIYYKIIKIKFSTIKKEEDN